MTTPVPVRTCIYTLEPGLGGVLALVHAVVALHTRLGFDVSLVYPTPSRVPPGRLRRLSYFLRARSRWEIREGLRGLAIPAWPVPAWLTYATPLIQAWSTIRWSDMHVVVSGSSHCGLPVALAGKRYLVWVATLYEEELLAKAAAGDSWARRVLDGPTRKLLAREERLVFERAALILANGPHPTASIRRAYPGLAERVWELTCPVDTALFRPDAGARARAESPYLLFTGRINDPRKNVAMLIRAFARVRTVRPDLRLVLAGERPAEGVTRAAVESGVADAVRFPGHLSVGALAALYQGAELFVLPSLQEGLGISMLEALACGLPVVATRCGGPEGVLVDGVTGRLVANDDAGALAAAILETLAHPGAVAAMRERCADLVAQRFAKDRTEAALVEAFRRVYPRHFAQA